MSGTETTPQIPPSELSFCERNRWNPAVFALACLAIIFVLYQVVAGSITFLLMGTAQVTRENVTTVRLLTMVGQLLFILIPTIVLARLLTRRQAADFLGGVWPFTGAGFCLSGC